MNETHRVFISDRARFTDLQDGTSVVMHFDRKEYLTLNESATTLWKALVRRPGATFDELTRALLDEYDVEADEAATTLRAFLDEMLAEGTLRTEKAEATD
jgi:hypothetical protein